MDPLVAAEKVHHETIIQPECGIRAIKSPDRLILLPFLPSCHLLKQNKKSHMSGFQAKQHY